MDIIKTFENNNAGMHITIKGSAEEPLFRASDIAAILEITAVRSVIRDFDITEKVVHTMHTPGGEQEVTFLTESGLYEIMFRSRKPIAKQFKKWVCEVIKEIRLNGKYQLEKQLKEKDETIKYKDKIIDYKQFQKESNLLDNFNRKQIVYMGLVSNNIVKFGFTNDIKDRLRRHKETFGKNFTIDYVFESIYNREIENAIKNHPILGPKIISKYYGDQNKTELIQLSKNFDIENLWKIVSDIKIQVENENNIEFIVTKLRMENSDLKLENLQLRNEMDSLRIKISSKIKMIDFKCSKCDYLTGSQGHIERHVKNSNSECFNAKILEINTVNKCEYCDRLFKTKQSLWKHTKTCKKNPTPVSKQKNEPEPEPESEPESEPEPEPEPEPELHRYKNNKAIKMTSFECSECGYTTGRKEHLKRHIATPTLGCTNATILEVDALHKCKYCDKLYKSLRSLQDHERKSCLIINA